MNLTALGESRSLPKNELSPLIGVLGLQSMISIALEKE